MDHILYLFFTFAYIALLIWCFKGFTTAEFSKWTSVIYIVVIALIYDNGILTIGHWVGEGELLKGLNAPRFWLHAFVTPLLVIFSLGTLREAGVQWASKTLITLLAFLYTAAAIIIEIVTVTANLQLKLEKEYGVISYSAAGSPNGPPIMILLITFAMLLISAILWKKTGWAVFFTGVVLMTIGSALPLDVKSNAIINLFELILLTSLVWTKRKFIRGSLYVRT